MGRFTESLKVSVQRNVADGLSVPLAFQKVRRKNQRAILEYDERHDEVLRMFDGQPPKEFQDLIEGLIRCKELERELLCDLDALEASGWSP